MVINKGASDTIYECAITVSLCLPFALQEQAISLSAEKSAVACRKGMKLVHQITLHDKIVNINIRTANTQEVLSNEKILSNHLVGIIPLLLCIAIITIGFLSMESNAKLQGNARIINYTGIIRGATQRLIKQELNHEPNDALIDELDRTLHGLLSGDEDAHITRLDQMEYQGLLAEMEKEWADIKKEISQYRSSGDNKNRLYALSEQYFAKADEAVDIAEVYTEEIVQQSRTFLIIVICAFLVVVMMVTIFTYQQEKRRRRLLEAEAENRRKSEQLARQTQQMLMPINEMTELMYVADIHTYDLLFVNDAGKKLFDIEEFTGLKCYKALQGFDKPCDFCPNAKLSKDETYTWEHSNPVIHGHYLLKDRLIDWEGREARMEIAFDITESLQKKKELEQRIKRDNILIDCIRELYQNHHTVNAMNHVLKLIGEVFEAERAYVFYMENDEMSNIAEWCREGITPEIDNLQHLSRHDYKWWFQLYDEQASIMIRDVRELQGDRQAEYELLSGQKIERLILVPFERYGNFGGMIGLDNLSNEDEKTLYRLSYMDTLTKFYNHNRYIQDVEEFSEKETTVGVAFIDVNGLKEINDRFGHEAGDQLLQTGAAIMQSSVPEGNLYRVGGDEFVIICPDVEEAEFRDIIQKLKDTFNREECKAAVGYEWTHSCRNLKAIIRSADQKMYEDKEQFYQQHAEAGRYRH